MHFIEDREENICIIVWPHNRHQTFETHAGINVFWKEWSEGTVIFPIKLDKYVVPYFYDIRIVLINQVGCVSPPPDSIEMDFAEACQYIKSWLRE